MLQRTHSMALQRRLGHRTPCRVACPAVSSPLGAARRGVGPNPSGSRVRTATLEVPTTVHLEKPEPPLQPESADSDDQELFNWYQQWYPVVVLDHLQHDRPNAIELLGMKLVLWKDNDQQWQCFEDLCPHRLAPLSEGRIDPELGLQCSYHGWTFQSDGSCSSIPQIGDERAHATACSSQRGCVKHFPVKEVQGLLWVFADSSADAWLRAIDEVPPTASREMLNEGWTIKSPWFQRDVPLSLDTLVENFLDPSHVPYSHHGVVGDRNVDQAMNISQEGDITKTGFSCRVDTPVMGRHYKLDFQAPALATHHFPGATMLLYAAPRSLGWCRVIMTFIGPPGSSQSRPGTPQLGPVINFFIDLLERVPALQHAFNRNAILDGDGYFLHAAERVLYARGDSRGWNKQYYMPSSADMAVLAWRKWVDTFGANLPTLPKSAAELQPLMAREQVFDRYNQHTKHCPHCSRALNLINVALGVLAVVAVVAVASVWVAATATTPRVPLTSVYSLEHLAAAAVATAVAAVLAKLRRKFVYEDYVHAEH